MVATERVCVLLLDLNILSKHELTIFFVVMIKNYDRNAGSVA